MRTWSLSNPWWWKRFPPGLRYLECRRPQRLEDGFPGPGAGGILQLSGGQPGGSPPPAGGGRALLVRDGALYWHQGQSQERLMEVSRIPSAFNGLAVHNLQNALAAAAAAIALGLSPSKVAAGLESFRPSAEDNPGRGNFYFYGSARVLLDYGHNPAALEATLKFASRLGCRRLIGVIGVPGDRSDQLIRRCGRVCAPLLALCRNQGRCGPAGALARGDGPPAPGGDAAASPGASPPPDPGRTGSGPLCPEPCRGGGPGGRLLRKAPPPGAAPGRRARGDRRPASGTGIPLRGGHLSRQEDNSEMPNSIFL